MNALYATRMSLLNDRSSSARDLPRFCRALHSYANLESPGPICERGCRLIIDCDTVCACFLVVVIRFLFDLHTSFAERAHARNSGHEGEIDTRLPGRLMLLVFARVRTVRTVGAAIACSAWGIMPWMRARCMQMVVAVDIRSILWST